MRNQPLDASSHLETCLIHHLSWAGVAVAWLLVIGDPLTLGAYRDAGPPAPIIPLRTHERSGQRISNNNGDSTGSGVHATSLTRHSPMSATPAVNIREPDTSRRLTLEETIEYFNQVERVPLGTAEKRDLELILNSF